MERKYGCVWAVRPERALAPLSPKEWSSHLPNLRPGTNALCARTHSLHGDVPGGMLWSDVYSAHPIHHHHHHHHIKFKLEAPNSILRKSKTICRILLNSPIPLLAHVGPMAVWSLGLLSYYSMVSHIGPPDIKMEMAY